MTDAISLNDAQLQKILTTLESLKSGGMHWEIFGSALLGFLVGIGLFDIAAEVFAFRAGMPVEPPFVAAVQDAVGETLIQCAVLDAFHPCKLKSLSLELANLD
ncbi:MAG: hypothetical protein WCC90_14520 [Methylocella sp.]|jgi:hypothetical protein